VSDVTLDQVQKQLTELRLKHWAAQLPRDFESLKPIEEKAWLTLLSRWTQSELTERNTTLIATRIKNARFKRIQTVEQFDFAFNKSTKAIQNTYLKLHRELDREHIPSAVFTGNTGLGKTHLSRALGYAACQKGLSVLFVTAAEMVNQLGHAQRTFQLEAELARHKRPQLLIIDELGYVSMDAPESNLFFQVISARHDQALGTIATTNLPFGKFNQIFANDAIAHVIVDRLVSDAELFYLEGPSYREYQRKLKRR